MQEPRRPGWGARVRVLGYVCLWLLEGLGQAVQLFIFLWRRKRIRAEMTALILEPDAGPTVEQRLPE